MSSVILFRERKGFTIFELLLSISILLITLTISLPLVNQIGERSNILREVSEIEKVARMAQENSIMGFHQREHGIFLNEIPGNIELVQYEGPSYVNRITAADVIYTFPSEYTVEVTPNVADIHFTFAAGTTTPREIKISDPSGQVRRVFISDYGFVTIHGE